MFYTVLSNISYTLSPPGSHHYGEMKTFYNQEYCREKWPGLLITITQVRDSWITALRKLANQLSQSHSTQEDDYYFSHPIQSCLTGNPGQDTKHDTDQWASRHHTNLYLHYLNMWIHIVNGRCTHDSFPLILQLLSNICSTDILKNSKRVMGCTGIICTSLWCSHL